MTRLVAAVVVLACAACAGERRDAEAAVRAYNEALIAAYRSNDASGLREVATPEEYRKVVALVDLKKAAGLVLESRLESLALESAVYSGEAGLQAQTQERWRYHDRAVRPGAPVGPEFVAVMKMEYRLVRAEERWKVREVRTLSNEFLEPRGHKLSAPAPTHGGVDAGQSALSGGEQP